jgi:hypothetical protein
MDFSILEFSLLFVGMVLGGLIYAGLQRIFFPHTAVNAFMDMDKLKEFCPELFKQNSTKPKKK